MLENLKLGKSYDGFLYLAESARNPPKLKSHHHIELELNLVVRGTITYVVSGRRFTFPARTLLLLCWRSQGTGKVLGDAVALHPAVGRALKLLSEGDWEHDLGRLAKACGVSEAYLSRTFSRQVGVPLSRYRNSLRLSRFWEQYR